MQRLTRRQTLAAGAAAAATAAVPTSAQGARRRKPRRTYDAIVVGAGLSGLTTARRLREAGRSVLVLEARRRVGGRNLDRRIAPGKVVELGGEWAGPGQDLVLGLAKELGVDTFDAYSQGSTLYYHDGTLSRYDGDIPPASPAALVEVEAAILQFNQMAAEVPADAPWTAPRAEEYDAQTVGSWARANLQTQEARDLLALAVRGVYGEEPSHVSLLDMLSQVSGVGGDFNTMIGDAQTIRFDGGPQQLSKRLAARVGRASLRLGAAVTAVNVQRDRVIVRVGNRRYAARHVVLTVPRPVLTQIRFSPQLPPAYTQVLQRQPMGAVTKINAIYDTPFWRADGLNGSVVSNVGPIEIVYDNSPPDGSPGVLVGFMEADQSRAFFGATRAARRAAAIECFVRYFGEAAAHPIGYHDMVWARERFTLGAYGTYNPPGVLTSLGEATAARQVGRLHFAGSDLSPLWTGYMDGAIRTGEAAAKAVLGA